jgi:hypothetical protein
LAFAFLRHTGLSFGPCCHCIMRDFSSDQNKPRSTFPRFGHGFPGYR